MAKEKSFLERIMRDDRPWEPPVWWDWLVGGGGSFILLLLVHFFGMADENGPPPLAEVWWIYLILFVISVAFYWMFTVFPRKKALQKWDQVKGGEPSADEP